MIIGHFRIMLAGHVFASSNGRFAPLPLTIYKTGVLLWFLLRHRFFTRGSFFARILIFLTNNFDFCFANDSRRGITMTSFLPWHGFWQLDLAAVKTVSNRYLVNFIEVGLASNSECVDRTAESITVFKEMSIVNCQLWVLKSKLQIFCKVVRFYDWICCKEKLVTEMPARLKPTTSR